MPAVPSVGTRQADVDATAHAVVTGAPTDDPPSWALNGARARGVPVSVPFALAGGPRAAPGQPAPGGRQRAADAAPAGAASTS
eukprot:1100556-Heterocapsa_arctica.AAC.1